jgi:hypothetical protein
MNRSELVRLIARDFATEEDFAELLFEVDLELGQIPGRNIPAKARELLTHMERRGKDGELLAAIAALRPHLQSQLETYDGWRPGMDIGLKKDKDAGAVQPDKTGTMAAPKAQSGMAFENFDLRVGMKRADGQYPVEVTNSPNGEMSQPIWQEFPLEDYDFTDLVSYLQDLVGKANDAVELGKKMKSLLFPGEVWNLFFASRSTMKQAGKGLRIRLRIDPPELSTLPWEYCYDDSFRFFALQRETPMVRYVAQNFAADNLSAPNPMKVLLAIAAPKNQAALNVDEEVKRVEENLAWLGDRVQLKVEKHITAEKLHGALGWRPHIFHFIGHGVIEGGKGALAFENIFGQTQLVDADQLMTLMGDTGVKVVILNACKTAAHDARDAIMGVAPALVRAEIPAVIAMQFNVPDKTALGFTRDLYRFLAMGRPLDSAVTEMRIGAYIGSSDKYFWGIPAIFMRAPDGVIWQPDPEVEKLFEAAMAAAPQSSGDNLPGLITVISNDIAALAGQVDERDLRYISRGWVDVQTELNAEPVDKEALQKVMTRLADDLNTTGGPAKAVIPKLESLLKLVLQLD